MDPALADVLLLHDLKAFDLVVIVADQVPIDDIQPSYRQEHEDQAPLRLSRSRAYERLDDHLRYF